MRVTGTDAIEKLKKAKDLVEIDMTTQEEYDKLKLISIMIGLYIK